MKPALARLLFDRAESKRPPETFTCPQCGVTSDNPKDAAEQYCGICHGFVRDAASLLLTIFEARASDRERAARFGFILVRDLADGRLLAVELALFGQAYVKLFPSAEITEADEVWMYTKVGAAIVAAASWQPDKHPEPFAWWRHPASGRRRPDGNPAKEYVRQ